MYAHLKHNCVNCRFSCNRTYEGSDPFVHGMPVVNGAYAPTKICRLHPPTFVNCDNRVYCMQATVLENGWCGDYEENDIAKATEIKSMRMYLKENGND